MEIQIITTKKKLTRSIVKQLEFAKIGDISHFNSCSSTGYYIRGLGGGLHSRVALFQGINGWKICELLDWSAYRDNRLQAPSLSRGKKCTRLKSLKSEELRDYYLAEFNKMKAECLKNHLII